MCFHVSGNTGRPSRARCSMYTRASGASNLPRTSAAAALDHSAASYGGSRKTMSNGTPPADCASQPKASAQDTCAPSSPHSRAADSMAAAARRSFSTKLTCAAPRDKASRPSAPLPAKRSRTRAPAIRGCSQLNRVSRTRSGVGRIVTPAGKRSRRPRCLPPMMRRTLEGPDDFAGGELAPRLASCSRELERLFAVCLSLVNAVPWLATFWGPSVR